MGIADDACPSPPPGLASGPPAGAEAQKKNDKTTFVFTLLRADNVPLGLQVDGESGDRFLAVLQVQPGGAVEAWNRQCAGEIREIRAGDRIVKINNADEADAMREQCKSKLLLKLSVERDIM